MRVLVSGLARVLAISLPMARGVSLTGGAVVAGVALSILTPMAQAPADRTVWNGVYSGEQAAGGQTEYASHCADCHRLPPN